ncbi:FAD-dependent oxidoreductase, partial [Candidatus Pelagibacter sp.]|nr:FAD-dependent oxidoreductase [Candidatus Pelagibacter sp.]
MHDDNALFSEFGMDLWRKMSQDLNYNVMFSPRGIINLAHSDAQMNVYARRGNSMRLNGIDAVLLNREQVKEIIPMADFSENVRFPIFGGLMQPSAGTARHDAVAWGYARQADSMGVDIIQNCEVTGFNVIGGKINGVRTSRGDIKVKKIGLCVADVETVMASMGKAMMGTGEAEGEGRALKAAEMAISNPLIDDYTLKGAKGLLINITGGKDLKLFEVDEAVNKVRAEVDPEAELIIGAITDVALDGKMRVSIVATSLDGQQPEAKSVINMVHRIQNRNPGYSDFGNTTSAQSFNFSTTMASTPITDGANALKLENEVIEEQETNISSSETFGQNEMNNVESEILGETFSNEINDSEQSNLDESINSLNETEQTSNGLENFGVKEESELDLFNSESESRDSNNLLSEESRDNNLDEDDLEIPAFLRRQKN